MMLGAVYKWCGGVAAGRAPHEERGRGEQFKAAQVGNRWSKMSNWP